ncbi:hypothetical protein N9W89_07750 [Hellea sp.]|nr:hypothetical protein [Hellea sp.]
MANLYPGVQTSRIPSGFRSIATVGTSTTAFIGIFERGIVDKAIRITSWGQFAAQFGGLWKHSDASYAVQHYFLNGGSVAYIVRTTWGSQDKKATVDLGAGAALGLTVTAKSEGIWGNDIHVGIADTGDTATYDLLIREYDGEVIVAEEVYTGLSIAEGNPRFADRIVNKLSTLVKVEGKDGKRPPNSLANGDKTLKTLSAKDLTDVGTALTGGHDGNVVNPDPGETISSTIQDTIKTAIKGLDTARTGIYALDDIVPDTFNLISIPVLGRLTKAKAKDIYTEAEAFCRKHYAFLLVDSNDATKANIYKDWFSEMGPAASEYAAGIFPRISFEDPENLGKVRKMGASGVMAGLIAKTDANRGFFKAPAGIETAFAGGDLEHSLTDLEHEPLNRSGVVCMRKFPVFGSINWGARTLAGADDKASEYKYISVARTALVIEASLKRGLQWAVFEGNDEVLWGQIRLSVNAFMQTLHLKGAFQGSAASEAYFVKCDAETTTQADIDQGILNIVVGFAPLKPAEFVFIKLQQIVQAAT